MGRKILLSADNSKIICRAGCPHPAGEKHRSFATALKTICRERSWPFRGHICICRDEIYCRTCHTVR